MSLATKPKPASFHLSEDVKRLLAEAARQERRTHTGMLEITVLEWCKKHRIAPKRKRGRK